MMFRGTNFSDICFWSGDTSGLDKSMVHTIMRVEGCTKKQAQDRRKKGLKLMKMWRKEYL